MWRASERVPDGPAAVAAAQAGRRAGASPRDALRVRPWWTLRELARAHARDPRLRMVIERFATYAGADPAPHAGRAGRRGVRRARLRRLASARRTRTRSSHALVAPLVGARRRAAARDARRARRASRRARPRRARRRRSASSADAVVANVDADARSRRPARPAGAPARAFASSGLALCSGCAGRTPGARAPRDRLPAPTTTRSSTTSSSTAARCATRRSTSAPLRHGPGRRAGGRRGLVRARQRARDRGRADWDAAAERIDRPPRRPRPARRRGHFARPATSSARRARRAARSTAPRRTAGWARCGAPGTAVRGVRGLWLVGGSVHPGGGLPLVALGGRRSSRDRPVMSLKRVAPVPRTLRAERARSGRTAPPSTSARRGCGGPPRGAPGARTRKHARLERLPERERRLPRERPLADADRGQRPAPRRARGRGARSHGRSARPRAAADPRAGEDRDGVPRRPFARPARRERVAPAPGARGSAAGPAGPCSSRRRAQRQRGRTGESARKASSAASSSQTANSAQRAGRRLSVIVCPRPVPSSRQKRRPCVRPRAGRSRPIRENASGAASRG